MLNKLLSSICWLLFGSLSLFGQDSLTSAILEQTNNFRPLMYEPASIPIDTNLTVETSFKGFRTVLFYEHGVKVKVEQYYADNSLRIRSLFNNETRLEFLEFTSKGTVQNFIRTYGDKELQLFIDPKQTSLRITDNELGWVVLSLGLDSTLHLLHLVRYLETEGLEFVNYHPNGLVSDRYIVSDQAHFMENFYENGNLKETGSIIQRWSYRVGNWEQFYEDGETKKTFSYSDEIPNQREGDWKWYDENGKIIRWEQYKDGNLVRIVKDGNIEE